MDTFLDQVEQLSGQNISRCYHCGKCSAGCPVAEFMDITPHNVNKRIILGLKDVLGSKSAWTCTACYTCVTRCPNDIDISKVFDALKALSAQEKVGIKEKKIKIFHRLFLNNVKKRGRLFEMGMIMRLKLKTKAIFADTFSGMKLFLKGKIGFWPHKLKDKSAWSRFLEDGGLK